MFQRISGVLLNHGYLLQRLPTNQTFSDRVPDMECYGRSDSYYRYYKPWLAMDFTKTLTPSIRENTLLGASKLYVLLGLLRQSRWVEGDILEAGVWSGGSARLMVDYLHATGQTKAAWLLDTFSGYAEVNRSRDGQEAEEGAVRGRSADEVRALFRDEPTRVHIVEGIIPASLEAVTMRTISFAHIDVNLYAPTRATTEFCLERMPRGGIILFDDYNWPATYGARQAIDEVCVNTGQTVVALPDSTQAFLIRN